MKKPIGRTLGFAIAVTAALCGPASGVSRAPCPPPPPPVRDIDAPRFYGDDAGSVEDPKLKALHEAAVAPLNAFVRQISQDADKAHGNAAADMKAHTAQCAVVWLETWAKADAWLGRMSTRQAEYQRKWDLAGVALTYIKVRSDATAAQHAVIAAWLQRWADQSRAFFDDPSDSATIIGIGWGSA